MKNNELNKLISKLLAHERLNFYIQFCKVYFESGLGEAIISFWQKYSCEHFVNSEERGDEVLVAWIYLQVYSGCKVR